MADSEHIAMKVSREFWKLNETLSHPMSFAGALIGAQDQVTVMAMDLFTDIRNELELQQFGEADHRDGIAEAMVAVIFRNEANREIA